MSQLLTLWVRVRCNLYLIFIFSVLSPVINSAATKFSDEMLWHYLRNDRAGLAMLNAPCVAFGESLIFNDLIPLSVFFFGQEVYQQPW